MKANRASQRYVSGPHRGDYYLLLDEQSEHIFETRLAERMREASGCDKCANSPTAGLLELWIDDYDKGVWYVFEARRDEP